MTKKRKLETGDLKVHKSSVEVIAEDVTSHPLCLHGPTLLFSSDKGRYFACSFCRNKKDCTIHIDEEDWKKESVRKRNLKYHELIPKLDKKAAWNNFNEVKSHHAADRGYCDTCQELFVVSKSRKHIKGHTVITPLTDEQLAQPSSWLPPRQNDAGEAQYLFTKKTISTVLGILRNNNIKNVICVGTPSVHEAAVAGVGAGVGLRSVLLDYDTRYRLFNEPHAYLWYNMFNDHLFDAGDRSLLTAFMERARESGGGACLVLDPPFGGRVEPLVQSVRGLRALHRDPLPLLWAFPYFAEPYVCNLMPAVRMHDYQVEYQNHKKFQSGGRKWGSPVRLFTDLPLATINLSGDSRYKLCAECGQWVCVTNRHCDTCGRCTGRNGTAYTHCRRCARCVKRTWTHCAVCRRCAPRHGHLCGARPRDQSCYECHERGHKRAQCPQLLDEDDTDNKRSKGRRELATSLTE